ncbi:MAG: hypothetical protein Q9213_005766 [Squamulea squamosa]
MDPRPINDEELDAAYPATWDIPPVSAYYDDMHDQQVHDESIRANSPTTWGRPPPTTYNDNIMFFTHTNNNEFDALRCSPSQMNSVFPAETTQLVYPALPFFSTPPSDTTFQSTPATRVFDSPATFGAAYSHQMTPATNANDSPALYGATYSYRTSPDFGQALPYLNDNLDLDQIDFSLRMFGDISGSDQIPDDGNPPGDDNPRGGDDLSGDNSQLVITTDPSSKNTVATARRKKSSPGRPRRNPLHAVAASGIRKTKAKAKVPLAPIHVDDPNDLVEVKRKRNTHAARNSRERRDQRFKALQAQNVLLREQAEELTETVDMWRERALRRGWSEEGLG